MKPDISITSIKFANYKALKQYSVSLQGMNVLVGPNNSGKSTVIRVIRVLEIALRIARTRKAKPISFDGNNVWGHRIPEESLPISLENIHTDYDESETKVVFRCSNANLLSLYFPIEGGCVLVPDAHGKDWKSPSKFTKCFPLNIQTIPELGPLEYEETLVAEDTVKRGLSTHRASRHFRNYWRLNPEGFEEFSAMLSETWPGMEIMEPEVPDIMSRRIVMFCREERIAREIYWAGFGFQVWCQLLTHISRAREATLLVVDEPEVYLHPDVQRQLVTILRDLGPDIVVASHSSEIIGESDPSEIVLIDKKKQSASRLKDLKQVQVALDSIGSIHNLALTHLARTGRLLFVESNEDSKILRRFAGVLGFAELSAGSGLTIIESEGFGAWKKIEASAWAFEKALAGQFKIGAVFDRDYFCNEEILAVTSALKKHFNPVHVHERKEIENYLLDPIVLGRAIEKAYLERAKRTGGSTDFSYDLLISLDKITNDLKNDTVSQLVGKKSDFNKSSGINTSTLTNEVMAYVDSIWSDINDRMAIVSGKAVLAALRANLQETLSINLSTIRIINEFNITEIPAEIKKLVIDIDEFRKRA